jgi:phage FluMu protein Com
MDQVRCPKCNKLLAEAKDGRVRIKCPKCKTLSTYVDGKTRISSVVEAEELTAVA